MPFRFSQFDYRMIVNGKKTEIRVAKRPTMRAGHSYSVKVVIPAVIVDGEETIPSVTKNKALKLMVTERPYESNGDWVVQFAPAPEVPRFLGRPPRGDDRGYTSFDALNAGAAVEDQWLDKFSATAHENQASRSTGPSSRERRMMGRKNR